MEYITICNLVMDCDNKLLKGGLTNPVACGLRQTGAENGCMETRQGDGGQRYALGVRMPTCVFVCQQIFLLDSVAFLSSFHCPKTTRLTVSEELFSNVP